MHYAKHYINTVSMIIYVGTASLYILLYNVVFGLHAEVAVISTAVCEIHPERREDVECLWIIRPELLCHMKPIHHFTLTTLLRLTDAMQKLHLQHIHTRKKLQQYICVSIAT